jgi:hypothetical protein
LEAVAVAVAVEEEDHEVVAGGSLDFLKNKNFFFFQKN